MSIIIWGPSGVGKTTWAATAPGKKLWISFGDSEHMSVAGRSDVGYWDLSSWHFSEVFKHGVGSNPFGLDDQLYEDKDIKTVVVDSLTAIEWLGLEKAVADGVGAGKGFTPTMQVPGRPAYGGRNTNLRMVMKSILQTTAKHRVHVIFTAHEDDPQTDTAGNIEVIKMALGGKLVNAVSGALSEVWNFRQEPFGKRNRIITVRAGGFRKPMKTRMFNVGGAQSFVLEYDPDKPDEDRGQMTIAGFYRQWVQRKLLRIPIPSNRKEGDEKDNVVSLKPKSSV